MTHNDEPDAECFYDDVSGTALDPKLVREAQRVETEFCSKRGVYYYDTLGNSYKLTGKKPIVVRWVDINKGDDLNPDYRSRLVAKEINTYKDDDIRCHSDT